MSWELGARPAKLGRSSRLGFGKHRGETVDSVIDSDPCYLEWCCDEVEGFSERLEDGIEDDAREAAEEWRTDHRGSWGDEEY